VESLAGILARSYGLADPVLARAPRGHTNETFFVADGARRLVLRRAWAKKPEAQMAREASVIAHLAGHAPAARAPRLVAAVDGAPRVLAPGAGGPQALHLFDRLPGSPSEPRSGPLPLSRARAALAHLAVLHRALAAVPDGGDPDPLAWLRERRARVAARGAAGLPAAVAGELPQLWHRVDAVLAAAAAGADGPAVQWLHGDVHAGNLLFEGDTVTGVVDFDEPGRGAPALEVALALFAVSRDDRVEDALRYDPAVWSAAAAAYPHVNLRAEHRPVYQALFCVDQVLIHLEASQRGLWSLAPGIGFQPCWRTLLASGWGR
jgi:Ser/Thr protein kinase RdoA (MazF antagonist)